MGNVLEQVLQLKHHHKTQTQATVNTAISSHVLSARVQYSNRHVKIASLHIHQQDHPHTTDFIP